MEKTRLSCWQPHNHIQPTPIRQRPDRAERTPPAPRDGGEVEKVERSNVGGFRTVSWDQTAEHPLENDIAGDGDGDSDATTVGNSELNVDLFCLPGKMPLCRVLNRYVRGEIDQPECFATGR